MQLRFVILLFSLCSLSLFSQEICDNAIDDDFDGLIDLNDSDCACTNLIDLSLIPNPSFEELLCCPTAEAMLTCASDWEQASGATTDYYNFCDFDALPFAGALPPVVPLPGGGEGFIGVYNFLTAYREYAGVCTTSPLLAGVTYALNLHVAYAFGGEDELDLHLFGSPNCGDLPWFGTTCPSGIASWQLLSSDLVTCDLDGTWKSVTLSFTPAVDINAIAIGGPCGDIGETDGSYFYIDELILMDAISLGYITQTGGWCSDDIALTAVTDDPGGTWQWYKNGIALVGETSATLSPLPYGEGEFSVLYTYADGCKRIDYNSPEQPTADFDFDNVCLGEVVNFSNTTVVPLGTGWLWDFGDGTITNVEIPSHVYAAPGVYDVSLVAYSTDPSCNDTLTLPLTILDKPIPDFSIAGAGVDFTGIDWIGCAKDTFDFTDLTAVSGLMSLETWSWNFGDGSTSNLQNPSHYYAVGGTYNIKLVVMAESGCSDSTTVELILTDVTADFTLEDMCEDQPLVAATTSYTSDGSMITDYSWDFGDDSDPDITVFPSHTYLTSGTYWVSLSIENGLGCRDSVAKLVSVIPNPTPNFYVSENPTDYFHTTLRLTLIDPEESSLYEWSLPGGVPASYSGQPSVEVFYPEFVVADYLVTVTETSELGCRDSVQRTIKVLEDEMVFAPNSFTPNGDPFNPDWGVYVEGLLADEFELSIFNRWGEIIWRTTDENARWNGTYLDGQLVQSGVYIWYLIGRDQITDEKFEYTGSVNVIR